MSADTGETLRTSAGDFPLEEYRLGLGGRTWSILHTRAVLSWDEESRYLNEAGTRMPYGVILWPAAIALAHDLASRTLRDTRVLELGAGTGLPGIVAASLGARVTQTDRNPVALHVCRQNGERNAVAGVTYRQDNWAQWTDDTRYDWIVGADILYAASMHPHLRAIMERCLAPGGRVLLADPFRATSLPLLEAMERDGWTITMSKWTVGDTDAPRPVGVYELAAPA